MKAGSIRCLPVSASPEKSYLTNYGSIGTRTTTRSDHYAQHLDSGTQQDWHKVSSKHCTKYSWSSTPQFRHLKGNDIDLNILESTQHTLSHRVRGILL